MKLLWILWCLTALLVPVGGQGFPCGFSALCHAVDAGNLSKVQQLLEDGADVNEKNDNNDSPLCLAAKNCQVKIAQLLLKHHASIETDQGRGMRNTPLRLAVSYDCIGVAQVLLAHGADPAYSDFNGLATPLDLIHSVSMAETFVHQGVDPWGTQPDGTPYRLRIGSRWHKKEEAREVQKYWQKEMTQLNLLKHTAGSWKSWASFFGGLAVAAALLMYDERWQKGSYQQVPAKDDFQDGAELLAAKAVTPSCTTCRLLYRMVEMGANVLFPFGLCMVVIWWPYVLLMFAVMFVAPSICKLGWTKTIQTPPLMVAATNPTEILLACLRCIALAGTTYYVMNGIYSICVFMQIKILHPLQVYQTDPIARMLVNPLLHSLGHKMAFWHQQNLELLEIPWVPTAWQKWLSTWQANDMILYGYFVPILAITLLYLVSSLCICGCLGGRKAETSAIKQDIIKQLIQDKKHPSEVIAGNFVVVPEVAFQVDRFFDSIYVKVALTLLDIVLDLNTVITLLAAEQFLFAFSLQVVVAQSLFRQLASGQLQRILNSAQDSAQRGILKNDLLEIFHEEKGFEAFFSICITAYSFLYCVNSVFQVATQLFSLLLSLHGLATFAHEQIDLGLADREGAGASNSAKKQRIASVA